MRWSIELGSYINTRDGKFYRTALVSNINYFSNLLGTGRYKVRQFLNNSITPEAGTGSTGSARASASSTRRACAD